MKWVSGKACLLCRHRVAGQHGLGLLELRGVSLPHVASEQRRVVLLTRGGGQRLVPGVLHLERAHPVLAQKVRCALPPLGHLGAGAQQVVGHAGGDLRVRLVLGVSHHARAHPLSSCLELARSAQPDKLHVLAHLFARLRIAPNGFKVGAHQRHQTGEVLALTREDLFNRHLLVLIGVAHGAGGRGAHVLAEPEGLRAVRGARVRAAHVLIDLAQRNVQVKVEGEDDARDKRDEDGESCVLEVGQLHLHRTELDAPADMGATRARPLGRRLPAHGLPVGAL
eukprot:scaffold105207_cov48-Phaeocystis_antarctica.AAC.1